MRASVVAGSLALALASADLLAGQQICGSQMVPPTVRTCPDGSLPAFIAEEVQPQRSHERIGRERDRPGDATRAEWFFGVWRTRIPGAVWSSPSGYAGYDWQHASTGVNVGDLIIKPDGTYVWNSYGGKSGRWERGDREYPLVLVDKTQNRRWRVGADPRHTGGRDIVVWDGHAYFYDGRR